jgi:6-phosphofructokinase
MMRIAVVTSGGDAPGMNACLRAVVRTALNNNIDIYGVERGYAGLVDGSITRLGTRSVSDMIHKGGTFLKTARCPEFKDVEVQKQAFETLLLFQSPSHKSNHTQAKPYIPFLITYATHQYKYKIQHRKYNS